MLFLCLLIKTSLSLASCTCSQLLSEIDCLKQNKLGCQWVNQACIVSTDPNSPNLFETYCGQFGSSDCHSQKGCQWLQTRCSHFTGCTAFPKTTDAECQAISKQCLSNGNHCFEKSPCNTYIQQIQCVIDAEEKYCYWNQNICVDVAECYQLPTSFGSDAECRSQIQTCTVKQNLKGCQESGIECSDQVSVSQCFFNRIKSERCFWNGTDCVSRNLCRNINIQKDCTTDNQGQECYWNSYNCVDKTCEVAPQNFTTNKQCNLFLQGCITKKSGGCQLNGECLVADLEIACSLNKNGTQCFWNSNFQQCMDKICINASIAQSTHELCEQFMSSCTVNSSNDGCVIKTCDNAPIMFDTNEECESYLTGCISKIGGGCVINTSCSAIGQFEKACIKDSKGNECVFNEKCKDKTCSNAPSSNNTHRKCQFYMKTCTVNLTFTGCVDMTCEIIKESENCVIDQNAKPCVWQNSSSKSFITHLECSDFMKTCTVDNSGSGCMSIPPKCDQIFNKAGCEVNSLGGKCVWSLNQCQDKSCQNAPDNFKTTQECNSFKQGCIITNQQNGCQDSIIVPCSARTLEDNCSVGFGQICLWNPILDVKCISKTCETSSQTTITSINGYIMSPNPGFSNQSCDNYLSGCIINNTSDGCIIKASNCDFYKLKANCLSGLLSGNQCFWNSNDNQCVDLKCQLIKLSTHGDCESALKSCTYGDGIVCQSKLSSCNSYQQNQCYVTKEGINCIWNNGVCREVNCADADKLYKTNAACQRFHNSCTVIDRIQNTGCVDLFNSCSDYKEQAQCYLDSQGQNCIWNNEKCNLKATFTCKDIVLASYTSVECEKVKQSCKQNSTQSACIDKTCSDNTSNCNYFSTDCVSTVNGKNCFVKPQICSGQDQNHCVSASEGQCVFTSPNCLVKSLVCGDFKGTNLTFQKCQNYSLKCSVNLSGTACIDKQSTCSGYSIQNNCRKSDVGFCKWNSTTPGSCSNATAPLVCNEIIAQNGLTYEICQDFDLNCSVNLQGTNCIIKNVCANYSQPNCYKGTDAICLWTGITCTPVSTANDCVYVTDSNLTDSKCQLYFKTCISNSKGSSCIELKSTCDLYNIQDNCVSSKQGKCYWYLNTCISILSPSDCSKITQSGLSISLCESYNVLCTLNSANTGCEAKQCSNKSSQGGFTDSVCSNYLSACTSNSISNPSTCVMAPQKCSVFKSLDTCIRAIEGNCYWIPGIIVNTGNCVKKSCSTAPINADFNTHTKCNNYLNSCTVARSGGCSISGACNSYKTQFQCQEVGYCFWNSRLNYGCVNKSCDQVETAYNTHALCLGTGLGCTVKTNSLGCQQLTACNTYTIEEQCNVDQMGKTCLWMNTGASWMCLQKSCSTAEVFLDSHEQCFDYLKSESNLIKDMCTVANVIFVQGGCKQLNICSSYDYEYSCVIDKEGNECVWDMNTYQCQSKSCLTAPKTDLYDTDEECRQYIQNENCTLDISGIGCTFKPEKCEVMTQSQCTFNKAGTPCEWFQGKCVNKTCETAPFYVTTIEECNIYMEGCTMSENKCQTQVCENFEYSTDSDCKTKMSDCTSNGKYCVTRGACAVATKAGCVTQFDGKQCSWNQQSLTCDLYERNLARFLIKSTCSSIHIESECSIDSNGVKCIWNNSECRNVDCKTLTGTTFYECFSQSKNCALAIGNDEKCIQINECQKYNSKASCFFGLNGPCLWISQFNQGQGGCFLYESCQSLKWTTDSECKWISDQCTTNRMNCVAITNCSETNTSGGCITGYDGKCMQTVASQQSTDVICKPFTSCTDAYLLTHIGCQAVNPQCTTDGLSSCMSLGSCSSYLIQEACKINVNGPLYDNGQVKSTGACQWDAGTSSCRDQTCQDLFGQTHKNCFDQLSSCTSNGKKCIIKQPCKNYKSSSDCSHGQGIDKNEEKCIWEENLKQCRAKICSDIKFGTTIIGCQSEMSSCISNGTSCIAQDVCSTYTSKTSCNFGGTDGVCVFHYKNPSDENGTCSLMSSCDSSNYDQTACSKVKDRCSWIPSTQSCVTHTCATFYATNPKIRCKAFFMWDLQTEQFCQLIEGQCKEVDPMAFTFENCYLLSNYTYTWNQSTKKCEKCLKEIISTNSDNQTIHEVEFSFCLKSILILVGIFYFI